jgi:hypothetical protein
MTSLTAGRGIRWGFALGWLATIVSPFFGPIFLQHYALRPPRLVAGSLYDEWFLAPAFLALLYLIIMSLAASRWQRGSRLEFRDVAQFLYVRHRRLTAALLICCCLATVFGTSGYWYADIDGVTIHTEWGARSVTYPWAAVQKRLIFCYRSKAGPQAIYRVEMNDDRIVDLGNTTNTNQFFGQFPKLLYLAQNAQLKIDDINDCPLFVREHL